VVNALADWTASRWMARGEHELPAGESWLTPYEAGRAAGMRFTKRRREYTLRRFAGKRAVAAAVGLPAEPAQLARIEVANRPGGAPYVVVDGAPLGLDVSLTDRAGWAVCVVGADLSRVGCDLEIVEPRSRGFVADFLTPREQQYVAAAADWDAAANLLWSAKESALKVLRTGLRRDTRSVEVSLADPHPETGWETGWGPMRVTSAEGMVMPGWWRREGTFLLTIASDRPFPEPSALAGSADLTLAVPVHSWVAQPLVE
jgi:4'-phosphopantetheinyl transferase